MLGLEIEEFMPLRAGETVRLEGGGRGDVLINHAEADAEVAVGGVDQLTGAVCEGSVCVPAGGVRVVRQDRD